MDELEFRRQSMLMDANYNQQVDLLNRSKAAALAQINANNTWSAEQAQKQMDFQERMSNTSHQREMEDLKAAGLNPVLSAQSGATSPSGAMAQADPNATSAMVSLMNKLLDIQNDNAKSQLALSMAASSDVNSDSKSKTRSGYNSGYSAGVSSKDITGYDLNGLLGLFGIRLPNSGANLLASVFNLGKNANVEEVSKNIDSASKAVAEVYGNPVPPKGTSAYKAYEYNKNTGKSSTATGLSKVKNALNSIANLIKGKKK